MDIYRACQVGEMSWLLNTDGHFVLAYYWMDRNDKTYDISADSFQH